jgi:hypothetical protein
MKTTVLILKLPLCWIVGCFLLWLTYSFGFEIEQGVITKIAAQNFVMKMSLIMTILVATSWLWYLRRKKAETLWTQVRIVGFSTAATLSLYLLLVLLRRNLWSAEQGLTVYAQFLPLVGRVNAEFLSGYKWITFLAEVIPLMSLVSASVFMLGKWRP